jgi:farnesyl diphosphate synthase/geranylgeranyl diphosphate synthase type II
MSFHLAEYLSAQAERCSNWLTQALPTAVPGSEHLVAAMGYSLLSGGKRLRPILALAAAEACGAVTPATKAAAVALEAIHAYSLIHDDLPAMDNDNLRRGQPTCHIAYGEATAILAGDALQTLAFNHLATTDASADIRLALIERLACASGALGMVAGQALDMAATDKAIALAQLETMHRHKTGALIEAAVLMGAISKGEQNAERLAALTRYARAIGLAFQVQDDILDVTGDTATLGKQQGADQGLNKSTYVSLLGLAAAQQHANALVAEAQASLVEFDAGADALRALASYVVQRGF